MSTDLPDGQITSPLSSPFCKNILIFRRPKSLLYPLPSCSHKRGASRSSRTLGAGCDGRGGIMRAMSVRTNDAEADGEDVWS